MYIFDAINKFLLAFLHFVSWLKSFFEEGKNRGLVIFPVTHPPGAELGQLSKKLQKYTFAHLVSWWVPVRIFPEDGLNLPAFGFPVNFKDLNSTCPPKPPTIKNNNNKKLMVCFLKNPISLIPSSIYYHCLCLKYPYLWKYPYLGELSFFTDSKRVRVLVSTVWLADEWKRHDDGQTDELSCLTWKSSLAFRCPFKYLYPSVLTIPSLQRAGWLKWGVTATSEDYIIPTKIKGSSDIWITGRFDWSTPCLFHSRSGVSKHSRFLGWVFRELLCHRWQSASLCRQFRTLLLSLKTETWGRF